MPHEPGHNGNTTSYKVYGTNENYSGLTVEVGGFMYSTVGGALEGNSLQLVAGIGDSEQQPVSQTQGAQRNMVPPLPDGTCPVGYTMDSRGNCVTSTGSGFGPATGSILPVGNGENNTPRTGGGIGGY